MIKSSERNGTTTRSNKSYGYDVESLLAPASTSETTTITNSKLTAKVPPFEARDNDLMEPSNPGPENVFPKGPRNQQFYPSLAYPPFGSPLALANHYLTYSLWSQAQAGLNTLNWPLIRPANPLFGQNTSWTQSESKSSDSNHNNTSRSQNSVKHQSNEGKM